MIFQAHQCIILGHELELSAIVVRSLVKLFGVVRDLHREFLQCGKTFVCTGLDDAADGVVALLFGLLQALLPMLFLTFFQLLASFWQTLKGPFSTVSTPNVASK